MKTMKHLLLLAALPALWGCASFNSGDMRVDRETARAMLEDGGIVPFADIEVSWRNFPYRSPSDTIGEGSASRQRRLKPEPVDPEDSEALTALARKIFAQAGLYDKARGRGTLRLEMTSFGRWTYGHLFRSFLVDTGFIFIIPASLRVNYYLTADFISAGGPVRVENDARNKTTFHLLMAPLYPFFSPGVKENRLLRQLLWRSATDVYSKLKSAGAPAAALPPKQEPVEETPGLSGPPVEPDRTWLPENKEAAAAGDAAVTPEPPDRSWTVPAGQPQKPAAAPAQPAAPAVPQEEPFPGTVVDEGPQDD